MPTRLVRSLPAAALLSLGCGPDSGADTPALTGASASGALSLARAQIRAITSHVEPPDPAAGIREVLAARGAVGRRVTVTGRCLGPRAVRAIGSPPRGADDWQLEADGLAIYVTGALPDGCLTARDTSATTITAVVAEDTLPPLGDLPAAPRRYLVRVAPQSAGSTVTHSKEN